MFSVSIKRQIFIKKQKILVDSPTRLFCLSGNFLWNSLVTKQNKGIRSNKKASEKSEASKLYV